MDQRTSYTSRELAQALYDVESPSRAQVTAAAQWARTNGVEPSNPRANILKWPDGPVDAALAERDAVRASGKQNRGNRERGMRKVAAARVRWDNATP